MLIVLLILSGSCTYLTTYYTLYCTKHSDVLDLFISIIRLFMLLLEYLRPQHGTMHAIKISGIGKTMAFYLYK